MYMESFCWSSAVTSLWPDAASEPDVRFTSSEWKRRRPPWATLLFTSPR